MPSLAPRPSVAALHLALLGLAALLLAPAAGAMWYEDVAHGEGLRFFRAGDRNNDDPSFIEIMGGGACWLDYDGDGWLDAYLVNGWLNDSAQAAQQQPHSSLFRNLGAGPGPAFEEVTEAAGVGERGWTQGCAAADYDGDDFQDLLVIGRGIQSLYRNQGDGTFLNVSASAGVTAAGKCPGEPCWGSSAAWADYDRDDDLDLYVVNFVKFDMAEGGARRGPGGHDGQPSQLYRNNGDGTFTDVTEASGTSGDPGPAHSKNWGVVWLDYNEDGWLDIYVASDGVPNILYHNHGNGTFTDVAAEALVADPRNGMGVAIGDCDDDGDEELFFTHYLTVKDNSWWGFDGFYINEANDTYTDRSGVPDLDVGVDYVRWGVSFEDLDNDSDLDLYVSSGHTENSPMVLAPPNREMPPMLWHGDGACGWTDVRAGSGPGIAMERMGRGTAYADYDHDGVMEVLQVNIMNQSAALLDGTGAGPHWLTIELRQPGANPQAVGAEVDVELPDGHVLQRRMMPYQSIHSSNPARVHVGLGDFTSADVTVKWPDNWETQRFEGLGTGQLVRLHRDGRVQDDILAPRSRLAIEGTPGEGVWYRSPVVVALEAEDVGVSRVSGVAARYLGLDGGPEAPDPAPLALGEGRYVLRHRAVDAEGNREPAQRREVGVDATLPVSTGTFEGTLVEGWYRGPVRVTLDCADALSGVGRVEWRLDAGAWSRYGEAFDLTRPGAHDFAWRCVDAAGNAEAENVQGLALDLGHPETLAVLAGLAGDAGWWRSSVTVTLEAAGGLHAVTGTEVRADGGAWQPYAGPLVLAGDGPHEVRFASVDAAGRAEPEGLLEVRIDATPPVLSWTDTGGPSVDEPEQLRIGPWHLLAPRAADATSGVVALEARVDDEAFRTFWRGLRVAGEGTHLAEARTRDAAGNAATLVRSLLYDTTGPHTEVLRPRDQTILVGDLADLPMPVNPLEVRAIVLGPATLEAAPSDPSGIMKVKFFVDGEFVAEDHEAPFTYTWDLLPYNQYRMVDFQAYDRVNNWVHVVFMVWVPGWFPMPPLPAMPVVGGTTPLAAPDLDAAPPDVPAEPWRAREALVFPRLGPSHAPRGMQRPSREKRLGPLNRRLGSGAP